MRRNYNKIRRKNCQLLAVAVIVYTLFTINRTFADFYSKVMCVTVTEYVAFPQEIKD